MSLPDARTLGEKLLRRIAQFPNSLIHLQVITGKHGEPLLVIATSGGKVENLTGEDAKKLLAGEAGLSAETQSGPPALNETH